MANNLVVQLLLKTGTFSNDLKKAGGEVKSFKRGCENAGDAVEAFTRGLGLNVGSLAKFSGYAAAAAGTAKLLKDAFTSNTDAMDEFRKALDIVKSEYKAFSSQMFKSGTMTVDFSGIAEQAKEYYNALDNAQVATIAINTQLKIQQVAYDGLYATAMDVSLSEVDRLAALNEATKVLDKQVKLKRQLAKFDKMVAKEGLESGLVNRGINKQWLENQGQKMLKDLLQFDEENGQFMFDTYYNSIDTSKAKTGTMSGHKGAYGRAIDMLSTGAGKRALEKQARDKGFKDLNSYLQSLKAEEEKTTETVNDVKYQLAQALHNLRGSNEGYEAISKYILLYLNNMGMEQVDAEYKNTKAMIERLRKRITGKDKKQYGEGSLGKVEQELEVKQEEFKEALTQEARDAIKEEIDALQATIAVMKGQDAGPLTQGTQQWLTNEIKKLDDEISTLDLGLPDTKNILQKMNDWDDSWEKFVESLSEEELELFKKFEENMKKRWDLMNTRLGYETALSASQGNKTPASSNNNEPNYLVGSYGKRHQELEKQIENAKKYLIETVGLSNEDIKAKLAELADLQQQLFQLEEQFGFRTTIEKTTNQWDEFNRAMANTSTIVSSLTSTFKEGTEVTAASILQMVATALPAIGQLISSISALTAVEAVEAGVAATGKAVSTSKHWIEAIAAVASLGAVVASALSAAHSQAERFANGGIVGGNSFTGDRVSAQVNSGEMILNRTQQMRLFQMANGSSSTGNQVEFHISGTDLVGVLNNQNRKNRVIR